MSLIDKSKKHHFISQAEQKLNAINPYASNDSNMKIYSFSIKDRNNYEFSLENKKGIKISNNLKDIDIFSFYILDNSLRYNFESLFYKYESKILQNTNSLLKKISENNRNVSIEITNIFFTKFLNFIRNPHSIRKVINTFPNLKYLQPLDPIENSKFQKILTGNQPHSAYICNLYNITNKEYKDWLSIIFLLLNPVNNTGRVLIEDVVKDMFESKNNFLFVYVYTYSEKTCALSDRGFSEPITNNNSINFDFNLSSNSFIRYIFSYIDTSTSKDIIDVHKRMKKTVIYDPIYNDLNMLRNYNQCVAYQCFNRIYNSERECYGLTIT
ncbi:hypothetical protein [Pseudoalteromonas arctica]|uniref:Uncharacterized protein n=1 Tax=Pseudoalteromonas arctica TaxID=394751 RepID=A0ABU9TC16_9GAMM